MRNYLLFILLTLCNIAVAQNPIKVDINEASRNNMDEVLEPGFTPWPIGKDKEAPESLTVGDATFTIRSETMFRGGWNKAFVQLAANKEKNGRLTGDGVNLDPNQCGSLELVVKGLSAGQHTIQTYHNSWNDKSKTVAWPLTVSLNGTVVHRSVPRTVQEPSAQNATVLLTTFTVSGPDDEAVLTFTTYEDDAPDTEGKTNLDRTPILNGFMIDVANSTQQAKLPYPVNNDKHADGDNGTITLSWSPANADVTSHKLYIGLDSLAVAQADETSELFIGSKSANDTTYVLNDVYSMNTYYWRVDELAADGTVTNGEVWKFRPRHLAFPGAEGYGRYATGGRGGIVYHVTNLTNDNEPGSFRYGLTSLKGPRTIVFDVSGIIDMGFGAMFASPEVTIAAQTAPGKGICLKHSNLNIGSESICRFLRARRGYGDTGNAMGIAGSNHTIIDHTTCSWGTDETFSSRNAKNVTFQYSMIAEALGIADHKNYDPGKNHGFAATIGGDVGTFSHNLLVDCNGRNWSMGGGLDGDGYYAGRLDIFNNVVYNWHGRTTDGGAHEINFVGNYYKEGPAVDNHCIFTLQLEGTGKGSQSAYLKNNILDQTSGIKTDASSMYAVQIASSQNVDWTYFVSEPFFPSYATIDSPQDAYKKVLSSVGAEQPQKDLNDQRMVRETLERSYTYVGSRSGIKGEIDHEDDCGGFEAYPEEQRAANYDTDQDGMPDWWEKVVGTDPSVADNNGDPDHDGYTNLEDFLNFLADTHVVIAPGSSQTLNLTSLFAGFTSSPQYTVEGSANGITTTINGETLTITANNSATGMSLLRLKVTDSENTTFSRQLGIAVSNEASTAIRSTLTDNTAIQSYRVYTVDGHLITSGNANGCALSQLPLGNIKPGLYVLKVIDTKGDQHSCKMIK